MAGQGLWGGSWIKKMKRECEYVLAKLVCASRFLVSVPKHEVRGHCAPQLVWACYNTYLCWPGRLCDSPILQEYNWFKSDEQTESFMCVPCSDDNVPQRPLAWPTSMWLCNGQPASDIHTRPGLVRSVIFLIVKLTFITGVFKVPPANHIV